MIWIKICGVTTPEDALFALECSANAIGLNYFPGSKRFLTATQAEAIQALIPAQTESIGVFVDAPTDVIVSTATRFRLRGIQTYTPLTPAEVRSFEPATRVITAFRVRDEQSLLDIPGRLAANHTDAILLDSHVSGEYGGTGQVAPWEAISRVSFNVPLILAGGLTPENVAEAIRVVKPWGVDVASGVESSPGRKDPGKVRAFVQAVRSAVGNHQE